MEGAEKALGDQFIKRIFNAEGEVLAHLNRTDNRDGCAQD
jgi:hypothetical protein